VRLGYGTHAALGLECDCECLMWDEEAQRITAMGLHRLRQGADELAFAVPVDLTYNVNSGAGTAYTQVAIEPAKACGFQIDPWWSSIDDESWKTHNAYRAQILRFSESTSMQKVQA